MTLTAELHVLCEFFRRLLANITRVCSRILKLLILSNEVSIVPFIADKQDSINSDPTALLLLRSCHSFHMTLPLSLLDTSAFPDNYLLDGFFYICAAWDSTTTRCIYFRNQSQFWNEAETKWHLTCQGR